MNPFSSSQHRRNSFDIGQYHVTRKSLKETKQLRKAVNKITNKKVLVEYFVLDDLSLRKQRKLHHTIHRLRQARNDPTHQACGIQYRSHNVRLRAEIRDQNILYLVFDHLDRDVVHTMMDTIFM